MRNSLLGAVAILVAFAGAAPAGLAQGLDAEGARETIIDAPVATEQKPVAEEDGRIVSAIGKSGENATEVRKRFQIGKVDIVFVEGLVESGSPAADTIAAQAEPIAALRKEIEGSAIFYHALASHQVLLRDVIAVEFGDDDTVTIFVAAPSAG
jgi:hypothetical protein